jgi:hypothetical protein
MYIHTYVYICINTHIINCNFAHLHRFRDQHSFVPSVQYHALQRLMLTIVTIFSLIFGIKIGNKFKRTITVTRSCRHFIRGHFAVLLEQFLDHHFRTFTTDVTTTSIVCPFLLSLHLEYPSIILFIFQKFYWAVPHVFYLLAYF